MTNIQDDPLRTFLRIPYDELKEMNLEMKRDRTERKSQEYFREKVIKYLTDEKRIKAVTTCFTDIEGQFHMLDYDKDYLLDSYDNLTFDGSSIHGFTPQHQSDLRLSIDWSSFRWLPSDVFGAGKVPEIGSGIGKGIKNFKEGTKKEDQTKILDEDDKDEDLKA